MVLAESGNVDFSQGNRYSWIDGLNENTRCDTVDLDHLLTPPLEEDAV